MQIVIVITALLLAYYGSWIFGQLAEGLFAQLISMIIG